MERKVKFPANIHYCLSVAIYILDDTCIIRGGDILESVRWSERDREEREDKPINNFSQKNSLTR